MYCQRQYVIKGKFLLLEALASYMYVALKPGKVQDKS